MGIEASTGHRGTTVGIGELPPSPRLEGMGTCLWSPETCICRRQLTSRNWLTVGVGTGSTPISLSSHLCLTPAIPLAKLNPKSDGKEVWVIQTQNVAPQDLEQQRRVKNRLRNTKRD